MQGTLGLVLGAGGKQRTNVEQEIGHFGRRHQFTLNEHDQVLIDHRHCFGDFVSSLSLQSIHNKHGSPESFANHRLWVRNM